MIFPFAVFISFGRRYLNHISENVATQYYKMHITKDFANMKYWIDVYHLNFIKISDNNYVKPFTLLVFWTNRLFVKTQKGLLGTINIIGLIGSY
jgi:hypothetical protein